MDGVVVVVGAVGARREERHRLVEEPLIRRRVGHVGTEMDEKTGYQFMLLPKEVKFQYANVLYGRFFLQSKLKKEKYLRCIKRKSGFLE